MRSKILYALVALVDWWRESPTALFLKTSLICGGVTGAVVGVLATLIFRIAN